MLGRNQYDYITPTFSGSAQGEQINMATSALPSPGRHGGEKSMWLHHACVLRIPIVGRNPYGYINPLISRSP